MKKKQRNNTYEIYLLNKLEIRRLEFFKKVEKLREFSESEKAHLEVPEINRINYSGLRFTF